MSREAEPRKAEDRYQSVEVAAGYDARRFGKARGARLHAIERAAVIRALERVPTGGLVLDVPCGTGRFLGLLGEHGHEVVGADVSEQMLSQVRKKGVPPRVRGLLLSRAEELPLEDKALSGAVCIRLMHHLEPRERIAVLKELSRVCRDFVIVSFHVRFSFKNWMREVNRRLRAGGPRRGRVGFRELREEAKTAGAPVEALFPTFFFFSERWIALLRPFPTPTPRPGAR